MCIILLYMRPLADVLQEHAAEEDEGGGGGGAGRGGNIALAHLCAARALLALGRAFEAQGHLSKMARPSAGCVSASLASAMQVLAYADVCLRMLTYADVLRGLASLRHAGTSV